jgi:hypothetical protein
MKKLSLYIFLVLMWCNVGFAKDLTGTKLLCSWDFKLDIGIVFYGLEFTSSTNVKEYSELDWEVNIIKLNYYVKPDRIDMEISRDLGESVLWRESLKYVPDRYGSLIYDCQKKDDEFSFYDFFQDKINNKSKEQESKNKL